MFKIIDNQEVFNLNMLKYKNGFVTHLASQMNQL